MAQHLTPQEQVDSTFTVNFLSIKEKLRQHQLPSNSESSFAWVVDFLSGQDFFPPTDWSGVPQFTNKGLAKAQEWYLTYRSRIEWPKLRRGLLLIASPLTDETATELEALEIK